MTTKNNTQNVSEMKKHPVDVLIAKRRTNSVPPHMKKCSVDILIAKRRIFGTLCVGGGGIGGGAATSLKISVSERRTICLGMVLSSQFFY